MPASGARSTTTPNRPRPFGDGKVGTRLLTCGHISPSVPAYRKAGANEGRYFCDACGEFRRRA